jgi:hypothetical protein
MSQQVLRDILQQPVWSKDVVAWIGSREALDDALQGFHQLRLDLLDLLPDDVELPAARAERGELLQQRLDQQLQTMRQTAPERCILRVENAALLARYGLGLRSFFDWFAGSQRMSVLEIGRIRAATLPETVSEAVRFQPDWLAQYFRQHLNRPDHLCIEA